MPLQGADPTFVGQYHGNRLTLDKRFGRNCHLGRRFRQPRPPRPQRAGAELLDHGFQLAGNLPPPQPHIAQQRAQTSKAEVRKASITDYLRQSGDHDIAEQYASGILDENGVASALAAKDKASTTGLTDDQKELAQINAENRARGLPEVSMAEYKATKNGTSPLSSDAALQDLPTVQVDDKGFPDHAQQEQFLATLKPDDATLVRKIANYEMDITKVTSLKGGDRARVAALVGQFDPTFDMTQYTKRAKSKVAYSTGPQGQAIAAANTSIAHLGTLYEEFGKLNNQPFTPWNSLANGVKGTFSDKELLNLRSTKQTVATELAKFFKGSGVVDVQSTQEWLDRFDEATGSAAMQDNIKKVIGDLMKARLDEIEQQYRSDMGKPADFRFLSIKTESILKDMGITADSVDPTSGIGAGDTSGDTSTDTPPADAPEETPLQVTPNDKGAWKALPKGRKYTLPGDPHIYEKQ